jgi:hypothetical protein
MRESEGVPTLSGMSGPYLQVGLDLAERALESLAQEDEASLQISVLLAFQATEAFVYSCLVSVKKTVFADPNKTIGLRQGLTRLEDHLRSVRKLKQGEVICLRPGLDRLTYLRDEIVHKAIPVNVREASYVTHTAADFIRHFCPEFHGFTPLSL